MEANENSISSMTKLISEYSVLIVACAILFVVFIIIITTMIRQNQKNLNNITEQNRQLISKLIENQTPPPSTPKEKMTHHLRVSEELTDRLRLLRDILDADRTYIFMFHNGEYAINKFPFMKASCLIEWSLYTVPQKMIDQKALPISIMTLLTRNLVVDGFMDIEDVESIKELDYMFYGWVKSKGAKSFFCKGIKDVQGGLIGFIACDYVISNFKQSNTLENIHKELDKSGLVISPLLTMEK